jgi:hypothetical protein
MLPGLVVLEDCIIQNFSRRGPEAKFQYKVNMRRCLIRNWSHPDFFHVRSFGAWAHAGGDIYAESCVFWQDKFFNGHFWEDLGNHIGEAWNEGSWDPRDYLMPGVCRGLTAGPGGTVQAVDCYAPWFVQIQNHKGPRMAKKYALELIEHLERKLLIS